MCIIPMFKTFNDYLVEQPDGSFEILDEHEIMNQRPPKALLITSRSLCWLMFELVLSETITELTYEETSN